MHSLRVEILGPEGQIETLTGTPIHPIWSVDRRDWVPLGELEAGELLQGEDGVAAVLSVTILNQPVPVYNIEVHGEHVYQVGELCLLVHNSCSALRDRMIAEWGDDFMKGLEAAHIIPQNGWAAPDELVLIIDNVRNAGLMDDLANGFASTAGHAGTHTKVYVDALIDVMGDRTSRESIIEGMNYMWDLIKAGTF